MRFGVLGPLRVWTADGVPVRIPEAKVRALLSCLLVHEGRVVSVDRLAESLWGRRLPDNPAGALQRKVWQLRRALEQAEPGARDLVVSRPPGYLLRIDEEASDAVRFHRLTDRARQAGDPRSRAELLSEALELWRGPAFADFGDEEFARSAITRLDEQWLAAVEAHAEARIELGEHSSLVGELGDLVRQYPLRERLRAVYLRALYGAGRQSEALDSYAELRKLLAEELGVDPGPELVALHQAILRQDSDLGGAPAPAAAPAHPRTNLPVPLAGLVGRTEAIAQVRGLLDAHRLVTLSGPGGVGKTQLALATANQLVDAFPDGVWTVELAGRHRPGGTDPASSPAGVADVVTAALGVRDDRVTVSLPTGEPMTLLDRLAGVLGTKRMLLLLDSCEHVVEQVAEIADHLLRAAPDLRLLATSQEPLGIPGEVVWMVPPLELPAGSELAALERSSAVRLFVARASAATPGFALDEDNADAVATLCRRLDGIPLALELAASRVRALGVHELVNRLDDRFRLLATGHRGVPPRQQTLRAMIDWSWELLSPPERVVLRRLAVHAEGCTLEAAEAVCAGDGVPAGEVADLLARLVDRSLVIRGDRGSHGTADREHGAAKQSYRLLESVASYCVERLREEGELESVRRCHYRYYAALAERADAQLRGPDQHRWLRNLDFEAANMRCAIDNAARQRDSESVLRLVNSLAWYWVLRGRLMEGRQSLGVALAVAEDGPNAARGRALGWQAGIAALLGDGTGWGERYQAARELWREIDDAAARARTDWFLGFALLGSGDQSVSEELVDQALETFGELNDEWGVAAALSARAGQAIARGDLTALRRDGERSLALFQKLGDRWGQMQATEVLSSFAEIVGDYEHAARMTREGLRIAKELGLDTDVSYAFARLGRLALLTRDYARAEELHERARRLAAERNDKPGENFAALGLALGARRQDKLQEAEGHLRTWLDWSHRVNWVPGLALILAELGFIAEQRGDPDAARAWHLRGLGAARESDDQRAVALSLEGLAGAQALAGNGEEAARLLGAAGAARESAGAPLPEAERGDVDRIVSAARTALGDEGFTTEFQRGAAHQDWYVHHAVPEEGVAVFPHLPS